MKLTPTFTGIVGALALTVMPIASASTVRLTLRAKEIAAGYKAIFLCCDTLCTRILLWTEEEIRLNRLPPKSGAILEAMLYRGEQPRAAAACFSGGAGITLDAGSVSGSAWLR